MSVSFSCLLYTGENSTELRWPQGRREMRKGLENPFDEVDLVNLWLLGPFKETAPPPLL